MWSPKIKCFDLNTNSPRQYDRKGRGTVREIFELILEVLLLLAQAAVRIFCQQTSNRPFHFFSTFDMGKLGQNRRHQWKERLKISKIAKFESDLFKTIEDTAPQSREFLHTFVWWGRKLAPTPPPLPPSHHHHHINVHKFSQLCRAIPSLT